MTATLILGIPHIKHQYLTIPFQLICKGLCPWVLSYKPVKFHPDLPDVRKDETAMGERCGGEKKQKERGCHHADHQLTTGVLSKMLLNLYGVCLDARRLNFLPDLSYWVNRCSLSNGLDGAEWLKAGPCSLDCAGERFFSGKWLRDGGLQCAPRADPACLDTKICQSNCCLSVKQLLSRERSGVLCRDDLPPKN